MLILDVKTQWSLTHQMLCWALQFCGLIFNYMAKDSELHEHELNTDKWRALELVTAWLKFFCSTMTQMSATKQPMLATTHTIFCGLQQQLKSIISGLPFDDSCYYTWAAHPRISYESLREDYAKDNNLLTNLEALKSDLQSHYDIHYAPKSAPLTSTSNPHPAAGSPQKVNFISRCVGCSGSAVMVEWIFSGGCDTIGLCHASVRAETIQTLMFVKAQLRLACKAIIDLVGDEDDS
ncbi:hypothetical protein DFH08DRAFT_908827 [Mycena albidolilacea]|uniref:Uncharacterized protein n=1 Tax=Mycena albidolilacea TaxID=1033008 RepID=A0AAD7AT79_9AGAR|nr:hypothetical protein DFH08DRAFT_908827 [Mycena albidolilacea]